MSKIKMALDGNKTYIVALAMVVYAAIGYWLGQMDQANAMELVMQAASVAGLRHAVNKV